MPISPLNAKDHALVAFGHALRAMRKSRGVSQEEMVHLCAIDRSYPGAIERGEQNCGLLHLVRIVAALNTSVTKLMKDAGL